MYRYRLEWGEGKLEGWEKKVRGRKGEGGEVKEKVGRRGEGRRLGGEGRGGGGEEKGKVGRGSALSLPVIRWVCKLEVFFYPG